MKNLTYKNIGTIYTSLKEELDAIGEKFGIVFEIKLKTKNTHYSHIKINIRADILGPQYINLKYLKYYNNTFTHGHKFDICALDVGKSFIEERDKREYFILGCTESAQRYPILVSNCRGIIFKYSKAEFLRLKEKGLKFPLSRKINIL